MPPIEQDDRDCVVLFSGGLTSYEAGKRALARYGKSRTHFWFSDTRTEDEDLYRFNKEVEEFLGIEIDVLDQGKDIWDVFFENKMMGSSRFDICSRILKREQMDKRMQTRYPDPSKVVIVIGMDDTEDCHRIAKIQRAFDPYYVWFPLHDSPHISKRGIIRQLNKDGIQEPRLYNMGFKHNNCGGFCVKAGYAHFHHLLLTMPDRYAYHEAKEQEFREKIAANPETATIMRYRINSPTGKSKGRPMTMKEFRERIESGERFVRNARSDFSCACLVAEPAHGKAAGITFDMLMDDRSSEDEIDESGFEPDSFEAE